MLLALGHDRARWEIPARENLVDRTEGLMSDKSVVSEDDVKLPTPSVMVARHGKLVKFRQYGYQVLGDSEPLREDAIYHIASMTKPMIAVAMLTLYEEGKWQLDDPVTRFIPEFADLQVLQDGKLVPLDRPMTMRHLMASSAGFPGLGSTPEVVDMYTAAGLFSGTNDEIIPKLAKLPLGSHFLPSPVLRRGSSRNICCRSPGSIRRPRTTCASPRCSRIVANSRASGCCRRHRCG